MVELVVAEIYEPLHINLHADHNAMRESKKREKEFIFFWDREICYLLHFHLFWKDYQHFGSFFAFDILPFVVVE